MDVDSVAGLRFEVFLARMVGPNSMPHPIEAIANSFETVYQVHYRDVFRHAILTTRGRDDAEEIVAETFMRAFAAWRAGQGPAGRPLPWLLVIARRIATDRWRRRRLIAWLPLPDNLRPASTRSGSDQDRPSEPAGSDRDVRVAEFWLWLDALSQALPARQRDVIFLRYRRDLTDAEIGEVLGLSTSGVRTLAARALSGLRKHPELWA
jgi:RNA polymerase sigma factor (sigma-70 family)